MLTTPLSLVAAAATTALLTSGVSAQQVLLDQQPTGTFGLYSEVGPVTQSNTEDFVVSDPNGATLDKITWWGVTDAGNVPGVDAFEISIHDNVIGTFPAPANYAGTVLHSWSAVAPVRTATGNLQSSYSGQLDEYRYEFTLATPIQLPMGHYHVQIYNDTSNTSDNFVWGCGALDMVNGVTGFNWASQTPGTSWNNSLIPANGMSLLLEGGTVQTGPSLQVVGQCGVAGSGLQATNMTPNSPVGFAASPNLAPQTVPGGPCGTVNIDLGTPLFVIGIILADGTGTATLLPGPGIPAVACGWNAQSFDIGSCTMTNTVVL